MSGPSSLSSLVPGLGRKLVAASLLGGAAFAALSIYSDIEALRGHLASYAIEPLLLALSFVLGNYALRFVRWQYYLRMLRIRIPVGESLLVFVSGFVMSVTPAKIGEVFKSLLLHESRGLAVATTAPIVFAERLTDLLALAILTSLGCVAFQHGWAVAVTAMLMVGILVVSVAYRPLGEGFIRVAGRLPGLRRLAPRLMEAYSALHTMTRPIAVLCATALAFSGWGLECAAMFVVVTGFQQDALTMTAAMFAYSASTLAGALAMLPGGLGVTEAGMAGLLQVLGHGRITSAVAGASTMLIRLVTLWFAVLLGLVAFSAWRTLQRARKPEHAGPDAPAAS